MIWISLAGALALGLGVGALGTTLLMARWFGDLSDRLSSVTATSASHFTDLATSIAQQTGEVIRETMRPFPVELPAAEFAQPPSAYANALAEDWAARTGRQPSWDPATEEFRFEEPDGWQPQTEGTIGADDVGRGR